MDLDTVKAADFGRSLTGIGLNILVRDVQGLSLFLSEVFDMSVFRQSTDFRHREILWRYLPDSCGSHLSQPPSTLPPARVRSAWWRY